MSSRSPRACAGHPVDGWVGEAQPPRGPAERGGALAFADAERLSTNNVDNPFEVFAAPVAARPANVFNNLAPSRQEPEPEVEIAARLIQDLTNPFEAFSSLVQASPAITRPQVLAALHEESTRKLGRFVQNVNSALWCEHRSQEEGRRCERFDVSLQAVPSSASGTARVGRQAEPPPGGGAPDRRVEAGAYSAAGRKRHTPHWVNQDACFVLPLGPSRVFAGVFDGHGEHGATVASSVRDLAASLAPHLFGEDLEPALAPPRDVLTRLFAAAHDGLARGASAEHSGTTATLALIDADAGVLTSAHVGDSRLIVVDGAQVVFATRDHDIDEEAERRILACGGEVHTTTISGVSARRVFLPGLPHPALAMSASLGDVQAHILGITSVPTIDEGVRLSSGSAVILASDGLWAQMTADEIAARVQVPVADPEAFAREAVTEAQCRWASGGIDVDDATAVVVYIY